MSGRLVGRLLDADGMPIEKRRVHAQLGRPYGAAETAYCDEDGWFEFKALAPGVWDLSSSGSPRSRIDHGFHHHGQARIEADRTTHMDLHLDGGGVLTGRIRFDLTELRDSLRPGSGVFLTLELLGLGDPPILIAQQDLSVPDEAETPPPRVSPPEQWTVDSVRELLEQHAQEPDAERILREGVTPEVVVRMKAEYLAELEREANDRMESGVYRFEHLEPGLYTLRIHFGMNETSKVTLETPDGPRVVDVALYLDRPVEVGSEPTVLPEEHLTIQEFLDAGLARL